MSETGWITSRILALGLLLTAACNPFSGDSPVTPGAHLFIVTVNAVQDGPCDGGHCDVIVDVTPRFHKSCVDDGSSEKNECIFIVLADRAATSKRTRGGHATLDLPLDTVPYTIQARHVATSSVSETVEITVR